MSGIEGEVIVADNGSRDGTPAHLQSAFPRMKFIAGDSNLGFAAANNRALALAKGRYILFLNPDTIIPEDCLAGAIRFFREHPDCGGLGMGMIDGSGRFLPESKRSLPTPLHSFFKLSGLSRLFPHSPLFSGYYATGVNNQGCGRVDVLSGAFLMAEKKLLDQLGGFDESFFMYGEDIDLSFRIMKAGYNNYFDGRSPIIHFKGESADRKTVRYIRDFYGAMQIFVRKHYHPASAFLMSIAVEAGKWISRLGILFLFPDRRAGTRDRLMVYFSGTQEQFDAFKKLTVSSDLMIEPLRCMDIEAAAQLLHDHHGKPGDKVMLFNSDPLSVKDIVETIMKYPGKMNYLFRMGDSASAVGSSSRHSRGLVIHG